jgi:hypothetical protein
MATSTIYTEGITNILLSNAKITPIQTIAELYHNSDDDDSTQIYMYRENIQNKKWFVFRDDNGIGMNMNDVKYISKII